MPQVLRAVVETAKPSRVRVQLVFRFNSAQLSASLLLDVQSGADLISHL